MGRKRSLLKPVLGEQGALGSAAEQGLRGHVEVYLGDRDKCCHLPGCTAMLCSELPVFGLGDGNELAGRLGVNMDGLCLLCLGCRKCSSGHFPSGKDTWLTAGQGARGSSCVCPASGLSQPAAPPA